MKKLLIFIITTLILSCQVKKKKSKLNKTLIQYQDSIIDPIEYPAKFKYGLDSISKLIYSNMTLTKEKGTVIVGIKIDSTGNIDKVEIMKSDNEKLNSEALRLMKLIPNEWIPAELGANRIKIASKYYFPIKFDKATKLLFTDRKGGK